MTPPAGAEEDVLHMQPALRAFVGQGMQMNGSNGSRVGIASNGCSSDQEGQERDKHPHS